MLCYVFVFVIHTVYIYMCISVCTFIYIYMVDIGKLR